MVTVSERLKSSVRKLYVGGQWVEGQSGSVVEGVNPATEEPISTSPVGSTKDLQHAIDAARRAFDEGPWPRMSPPERAKALYRFAEAIDRRHQELHDVAVIEAGSLKGPFSGARACGGWIQDAADRAVSYRWQENLHTFDSPAMARLGQPLSGGAVLREPIGVAGLITPFNAAGIIISWKLSVALAAGNTVILKPSPYAPLQATFYAEAAEDADLPPGVLNVVTDGPGVGEELSTNPGVDVISFTGSTDVGRKIMAQASGTLKRLVLELGGKSASIVFADALEARPGDVARHTRMTFMLMAGQACMAKTRILVEASAVDAFLELVTPALTSIKIGDPAQDGTEMGPLIRETACQRVDRYVNAAVDEGGAVAYGGRRPPELERGFFYEPTLLTGVDNRSAVAQEEIFGPVVVVMPFRDEDDAVRIANDSPYGLSAAVFSSDMSRAWRVAGRLRTGRVDVNGGGPVIAPIGGVKQSGFGREMAPWGLDDFTQTKAVTWPL